MKILVPLLVLFLIIPAAGESLHSEAASFLQRLTSRGYTGTGIIDLELNLLEPCTVIVYSPVDSSTGGFYAALGGNNILDLYLRVEGENWFIEDSMPDDLPVLSLDSVQVLTADRLIIRADDMIRGFLSDSATIIRAFVPVDRNN